MTLSICGLRPANRDFSSIGLVGVKILPAIMDRVCAISDVIAAESAMLSLFCWPSKLQSLPSIARAAVISLHFELDNTYTFKHNYQYESTEPRAADAGCIGAG